MRLSILGFILLAQTCTAKQTSLPKAAPECTLYLAPSSITNAGLGLYTTRHIPSGQPILSYNGPDAPSILVTNSLEHHGGVEVSWSHVDYFWSASGLNEFESNHVEESVMTMGALSNYHTYLKNIKPYSVGYDDTMANRFTDPSAGAFSYYLGHEFKATKAIFPGEELFADYGESWLKTREGTFADFIPRSENYDRAAAVLKTMQLEGEKSALVYSDAILNTVKNVVQILEPLAAAVLPTSASDYHRVTHALQQASSTGTETPLRDILSKFTAGSRSKSSGNATAHNQAMNAVATELAKRTVNITQHSVEWIKQNGLCLENILPGKSTIPLAGQGGFAARNLPKGSLISPAPLIQIPDRNSILTYELVDSGDDKTLVRKNDTPIGSQLLLNYCFGHKDSRLLLCPQTNAILINHCSSRKAGEGDCGSKGPNAKVQWAGSWDPRSAEWLEKSLSDIDGLTVDGMRGLSFDIVATRDIQQGEEIFIDYGIEWENAWDEHLRSWEPPSESSSGYSQLKPMLHGEIEARTLEEQETNPYPENIMTGCYYNAADELVDSTHVDDEYHADGSTYDLEEEIHSSNSIYACEILSKQEDGKLVVRILVLEGFVDTPIVLRNYPLSSVTLRMRRRSSDQHLPGTFRHAIGIDDSIFPSQWKDGLSSVKSEL